MSDASAHNHLELQIQHIQHLLANMAHALAYTYLHADTYIYTWFKTINLLKISPKKDTEETDPQRRIEI